MQDNEREQAKEALRNLFLITNKAITKEKVDAMIKELEVYHFKAIMAGLSYLKTQNVPALTLFIVIQAIRKYIEPDRKNYSECEACSNSGMITLLDENENEYGFACKCQRGREVSIESKLVQWNGFNVFYNLGKKFKRKFEEILILTENETEFYNKFRRGEKVELCPF